MTGKTVLITGANSGIGFEAAVSLAGQGAHIVMACRDAAKGQAAVEALIRRVPGARPELALIDLGDLSSVAHFASDFNAAGRSLDVLINNAGVMSPPRRLETKDGFELQFGTNVVGHFALTMQLMPALKRAKTQGVPRIVTVASIAHKRGHIDFDDLQSRAHYDPMTAYAQSKLADLILAIELDRLLKAAGSPMLSVAAHPGVARTSLFVAGDRSALDRGVRQVATAVIGLVLNSQAQGALPLTHAATAPDVTGGSYWGPQGLAEARGATVGPARISPQALNAETGARLWAVLETLSQSRL